MKTFLLSAYYQLLIYIRVKIAVFFSFVFPIFIFVVFSFIWGYQNPAYSKFLLTGVIIMKVMSDGLFSIGNIIVKFYQEGFVKFFKGLPYSFMKYIGALITSRIINTIVTSAILLGIGILFFHTRFRISELIYILLGIVSGFIIFSFLGMVISIFTADKGEDQSVAYFIYFIMLFLSNIFYPLNKLNPTLGKAVYILPINPVVALTRGDVTSSIPVIIWGLIFITVSYISFQKHEVGL